MVEGGARAASSFHAAGLVDRYVFHLAPALMGDGPGALHQLSTPTIAEMWRGRIVSTRRLGDDLEVVVEPIRL
jgi:diaminohydroxyphosphoribosylaminopyrimidine deaminase/5-amino-6-(5-phosphoribosylamino)uracil reductase